MNTPNYNWKIFVRAPNWVGDLVMATSTLEALANSFKGGIYLGLKPHLKPIVSGLKAGEKIIPCYKPKSLPSLFKEIKKIKIHNFNGALLLTRSFETALIVWLAKIPFRAGLLDHRGFLLTNGFKEPYQKRTKGKEPKRIPRYMGDLYRDLAKILNVNVKDTKPILAITEPERTSALTLLESLKIKNKPYFLINPGASYGSSKLWPVKYMAKAGKEISKKLGYIGIVLSGPSKNEQEMAEAICKEAGYSYLVPGTKENFISLGPLKAIVAKSQFLLTTDTGPRHIAVAFSVPHVVLMGPTDPRFTNKHLEKAIVIRKEVECGPCHEKKCPYPHHKCMTSITPDEVVNAVLGLVENKSSK